jgi:hypothetical protein
VILQRRYKKSRFRYYLEALATRALPQSFFTRRLERIGRRLDAGDESLVARVRYCNRLDQPFRLVDAPTVAAFRRERQSTYHLDLDKHLRAFDEHLRLRYAFGDVIDVPAEPSFVKSRPIEGDNRNAVLMRLDEARHFVFVRDRLSFEGKRDGLVWRGAIHRSNTRERRLAFLERFHRHPSFDVGHVNHDHVGLESLSKPRLSIDEQLRYKFVLSLEGNDVATNLKWIMSSQSVAVTCKLRYETWFMEGQLQPGVHYIQVADDFSDLQAKLDHYLAHPDEALRIVAAANAWVEQFKDPDRERLLAHHVARRYFELSGQLPAGR